MVFFQAVSDGLLDTFKCDSCIESRALYLVPMSSPATFLVGIVGLRAILDGFGYKMDTASMAWEVMRSIDRPAVMPESVAQQLPF